MVSEDTSMASDLIRWALIDPASDCIRWEMIDPEGVIVAEGPVEIRGSELVLLSDKDVLEIADGWRVVIIQNEITNNPPPPLTTNNL